MNTDYYLKMLVEDFHSTTVATIGADGHPQTRVIDMMLWDPDGVYFLTAKGKAFYTQLIEQQYIALSATKSKAAISLRGQIRNIGSERLDEIFDKNTYMQSIYPGDTRTALEVFQIYEAQGEYFDISDSVHIIRESFVIGKTKAAQGGYAIGKNCVGCSSCYETCPQKCIDLSCIPAQIDQNHCLHCGRCKEICPVKAIEKR